MIVQEKINIVIISHHALEIEIKLKKSSQKCDIKQDQMKKKLLSIYNPKELVDLGRKIPDI